MPLPGAEYGWIITKDHIFDPTMDTHTDVGTMGPRNITKDNIAALKRGEGLVFKMYDDDRNLYYEGRYVGPTDSEEPFGPLNDFGTPNAGAVIIQYREHWTRGKFTDL